ncbi:MAG: CcoQ/FixQ family Cbb3-type cytochrome c oxidase assembly chaperone [Pusillimonas sp.]|nr:CcoQ/FixQ family Cbb3-type cytochrome c oxidase assembly chaperone [Pusillimonas sp.]
MGIVNGIVTIVALIAFIAIVFWAFSKSRKKANKEASMLPFMQPDEDTLSENKKKTPDSQDKGDSHD